MRLSYYICLLGFDRNDYWCKNFSNTKLSIKYLKFDVLFKYEFLNDKSTISREYNLKNLVANVNMFGKFKSVDSKFRNFFRLSGFYSDKKNTARGRLFGWRITDERKIFCTLIWALLFSKIFKKNKIFKNCLYRIPSKTYG